MSNDSRSDSALQSDSKSGREPGQTTPEDFSDEEEEFGFHDGGAGESFPLHSMKGKDAKVFEDDPLDGEEKDDEYRLAQSLQRSTTAESFELYTPDEARRVIRKLDRHVVLFMALLYLLSFLDRSNIGNARIAGMMEDLHLTSSQYEWLLESFYIPYITFEWMTLLYRVIAPHVYISATVLFWSVTACLQAFTVSFATMLPLRLLLGLGEAAFSPGIPFYFSFFYRREELALRTGVLISAAPLATSFASSLAWGITKLAGTGGFIAGWRLLFLVEGLPGAAAAVAAFYLVPDSPSSARFLTPREREVASKRLRAESSSEQQHGVRKGINFREVLQALADPKCYITAAMFFSCNVAFSSMPVFTPKIINEMGYTALHSQALSAPPYLLAFIVVLATAYLSDRHRVRSSYIMLHATLAFSGFFLILISRPLHLSNGFRYAGIYPATAGFFSCVTLIISWTLNNQDSDSKKGTGMAILNFFGQCGPILGMVLYPDSDAPYYTRGITVCAFFMAVVGVLAWVLRKILRRENDVRQRQAGEDATDAEPLVQGSRKKLQPFLYLL